MSYIISTIKYVKNEFLTNAVIFGIGSAFSKGPGSAFLRNPGPFCEYVQMQGEFGKF